MDLHALATAALAHLRRLADDTEMAGLRDDPSPGTDSWLIGMAS